MSFIKTHSVTITTDASGDATAYTDDMNGLISQIVYVKDDFATGVDFTITAENTGENIWTENDVNASVTKSPRQATHGVDGSALLYASSGEPVDSEIAINGRIKVVIANGGNAKSGTFYFLTK